MRDIGYPEVMISVIWAIVPIAFMFGGVMVQRLRTQERLRAIEKGVPLPPEHSWKALSQTEQTANFRVGGIICVAAGLGLLVLFSSLAATLPQFPKGVIGASAIPFFIGLGLLFEYRMRRREMDARERSTPR